MTNAYVLHSGGVDSSTCLHLAKRDHDRVVSVSIDYGQRHKKEMDYANQQCESLGIKHVRLDGPKNLDSMLTDERQEIPSASYDELPKGVSPTYVPFRNGQLLIGFHHNVPDNTLPILWFDSPNADWRPIFRRYPKW